MSKSTGVGRGKGGGGAQPGAGRPRKHPRPEPKAVAPQALAALPVKPPRAALTLRRMTLDELREMARNRASLIIETLVSVAQDDERGSARVAAAKELREIGFGTSAKPTAGLPAVDRTEQATKGDGWAGLLPN